MKKHLVFVLASLLTACMLLASCGTQANIASNAPVVAAPIKTDFVIALQGEPSSLDVHYPDDGNMYFVTYNVYESLYKMNGTTLKPDPCLATGAKKINDTTWEFTLREGVKWHDNTDFTAEDAAFSINRIIDPDFGSQNLSDVNTIEKAEVIDAKTIRVTTVGPDPILLKRLTKLDILQKAFYEGKTTEEVTRVAMGTGPYKLDEWKTGEYIKVSAFDNYWGEKPSIKNATFRFIEEPITRLSALKTKEIDFAVNMYPEYAAELPKVFSAVGMETYWIRFNQISGAMKDKKIRLAANYAIDLQGLADSLFLGYAAPAQGQMGREGYFGYAESVKAYGYDPEKARTLLKEAGYNGEVVQIISERGRWLKDGELSELVATQMTEAGFNVELKFISWNEYLETMFDKNKMPHMQYSSNSNEFFDMDKTYSALVHSAGTQAGMKNAEYDQLIEAARVEMDDAKREAMYAELTQKLHEDPFALFLLTLNDLHGGAENLNWTPRQDSKIYISEMSFS